MRGIEAAGMGPDEFTRRTGVSAEEAADPRCRIGRDRYERVLSLLHALPPPPPRDAGPGLG